MDNNVSSNIEALRQRWKNESLDYGNNLMGRKKFPDTGRTADNMGETLDSYLGAPARQAAFEAFGPEKDDGEIGTSQSPMMNALKRIWGRVGNDPRNAPKGSDVVGDRVDNPYAAGLLDTAVDVGAQVPVGLLSRAGLLPGVSGIIKGVKNEGKIADAAEAFAERGKQVSPDTKIAQMYGETGDVRDAMPQLVKRAENDTDLKRNPEDYDYPHIDKFDNVQQKSAFDNPRNAPPKPMEPSPRNAMDQQFADDEAKVRAGPQTYLTPSKDQPNVLHPMEEFKGKGDALAQRNAPAPEPSDAPWHDVNDHSYSENAKQMMDSMSARGIPDEDIISAQGDANHPYSPDPNRNRFSALPNYQAKVSGQIGSPGISQNSGPTMKEPFPWMDSKFQAGKELLQKHQSTGTPAQIHTSSDLIGRQDYIDSIPEGSTVNIHKLTNDDTANRLLFPANPSNKRLDAAADKLKDAGIKTNVIEPTVEQIIDAAGGKKEIAERTGMEPDKQEQWLSDMGHLTNDQMAAKPAGPRLVKPNDSGD